VKDQFVSRGDMYRFQSSVVGKWIYEGERLSLGDGIRGTIMDIRHGNEGFKSAFITEDSKITFRSMSARIICKFFDFQVNANLDIDLENSLLIHHKFTL